MIDDYAKTMALIRKMEATLPISARPTGALIQTMKSHGVKITRNQALPIKRVFYLGDEGGISCEVTPPGMKEPIICSITHITIDPSHPLAAEIQAYQTERVKRLARAGGFGKPAHFTVRPRKKRKR